MNSSRSKASIILDGVGVSFLTFIGIETGALVLAIIIRLVERYTGWFYLGVEWNTWLGGVLMYWAALPAMFLGLVVGVRQINSRWKE